jgi:hypothetical protein
LTRWIAAAALALPVALTALPVFAQPAASAFAEDGLAVEVEQAVFGVLTTDAFGRPKFHPTRWVPYTPGRGQFGWMVMVRTQRPTLRWREELTLPDAPATWGGDAPQGRGARRTISPDRRTATTEAESPAPMLMQLWQVAPGDPKGAHTIRVSIEGAAPIQFDFEIQ